MAIILAIIVIQIVCLVLYLIFAEIYFLFSLIFFLLYFWLKFHDLDEYTGNRAWPYLRSFMFNPSVTYSFVDKEAFRNVDQKFLFVVVGNLTNMGLISAFGFHGNTFKDLDLVYLLPRTLFKIPIVRDILLWSGACVNNNEDTIFRLMNKGKSVVYCPSGMNELLYYTENCKQLFEKPPLELFEFILKQQLQVVPVYISNEDQRYWIWKGKYVSKVQKYCSQTWLKWPFPLLFAPRIFGQNPPSKVAVFVGPVINSSLQNSAIKLSEYFNNQFKGIESTEV